MPGNARLLADVLHPLNWIDIETAISQIISCVDVLTMLKSQSVSIFR